MAAVASPPTAASAGSPNNVRPSLIRITMEVVDANGRLTDGQRIEFIFPIKAVTAATN